MDGLPCSRYNHNPKNVVPLSFAQHQEDSEELFAGDDPSPAEASTQAGIAATVAEKFTYLKLQQRPGARHHAS